MRNSLDAGKERMLTLDGFGPRASENCSGYINVKYFTSAEQWLASHSCEEAKG
jgi:hypothetical protein